MPTFYRKTWYCNCGRQQDTGGICRECNVPLQVQTDPSKMGTMTYNTTDDVQIIKASLEAELTRSVPTGRKLLVKAKGVPAGVEAFEEIQETRHETADEKVKRIAEILVRLQPLSVKEAIELRDKFEHK